MKKRMYEVRYYYDQTEREMTESVIDAARYESKEEALKDFEDRKCKMIDGACYSKGVGGYPEIIAYAEDWRKPRYTLELVEEEIEYDEDGDIESIDDFSMGPLMSFGAEEYNAAVKKEEGMDDLIEEKSKYYNMKQICELAGINYETFRGYKNKGHSFSSEKKRKILKAMKKAAE